ncbi:hypothetical protein BV911_18285 [Pseudoruegeria sp. SK021]|nr:hypothetical protein BV911_18285 [Pseudoruegeria sp. SK021]
MHELKRRGLARAPDLAVGDGALGFWAALREVFGATREQRCWFHKTGNVLNGRLGCATGSSNQWTAPKSLQAKAKGHLHDIWQAERPCCANRAWDSPRESNVLAGGHEHTREDDLQDNELA